MKKLIPRIHDMLIDHRTHYRHDPTAILVGPVEYAALRHELEAMLEESRKYGLGFPALLNGRSFSQTMHGTTIFDMPVHPKVSEGIEFAISPDNANEIAVEIFRKRFGGG